MSNNMNFLKLQVVDGVEIVDESGDDTCNGTNAVSCCDVVQR